MNLTNSSIFLLRGLHLIKPNEIIDRSSIVQMLGFKNAYIRDINHETDLEYPLFLLFSPPEMAIFNEFLEGEYEYGQLKEDYDYPNNQVVLVYDFPESYKNDYKLIIEGKYSQVSEKYKKLFPETYKEGGLVHNTLTFHVFNKTKKLREEKEKALELEPGFLEGQELWELFNIEKETLKIDL